MFPVGRTFSPSQTRKGIRCGPHTDVSLLKDHWSPALSPSTCAAIPFWPLHTISHMHALSRCLDHGMRQAGLVKMPMPYKMVCAEFGRTIMDAGRMRPRGYGDCIIRLQIVHQPRPGYGHPEGSNPISVNYSSELIPIWIKMRISSRGMSTEKSSKMSKRVRRKWSR